MLRGGARGAWRVIEERLRPFVVRRVPRPNVEDVLQEILFRVHRGIPGLRDDERFLAWMYQVARSAVQDDARGRARHPLASAVASVEQVSDDDAVEAIEPDDGFGECELASNLAPLVARLPSPYREAITLVELEGQTQAVAATLAGITVSGMKSRVQRGRRLLRELLLECCAIAIDARGRVISAVPRGATDPDCCRTRPRHDS